jgi:nucleotide-binding universal stress UspA family protein
MNTILIPLDGSDLSREVLPYAQMLAQTLSAQIHLLRAVADAPAADVQDHMQAALEREAQRLREVGLHVSTEVVFQSPPVAIVQKAKEKHPTLIAMATHGYSGLRRWALGSVADEVVHTTTTPIFLVRCQGTSHDSAASMPKIQRILVPLDGSELSKKSLPIATLLASKSHAKIDLLQAILPLQMFYDDLQPIPIPKVQFEQELAKDYELAETYLQQVADSLGHENMRAEVHIKTGKAEDVIIEESEQQQSDIIVMATHGYGGIERFLLGSVADKVLHATTTPLLLVQAKA